MLLADSFIFVVGLLFLIGIVGFFVMIVVLVVRFFGFFWRLITGSSRRPAAARFEPRHDVCPHQRCGHVNRQGAFFCARCGRSLHPRSNVDAYG